MTVLETPRTSVSHVAGMFAPWTGPFPAMVPVEPVPSLRPQFERALTYLRGDRAFPQLIRFALVGGSSNIAYVLLFFAMHGVGPLIANVAGSVVSTVIANELHRQLTFHAADRVTWFTAQWEGGGLALLGLGITTAGLAALGVWAPGLGDSVQALAVLAITAAVGGMRFLALRGLVF
ncbi:GtrA family protein [Nocardia asteroides]|uniref:GtrA family protein n=1 Tax=Nocardia asteroides TaxID=1824 RepID=UPI0034126F74